MDFWGVTILKYAQVIDRN